MPIKPPMHDAFNSFACISEHPIVDVVMDTQSPVTEEQIGVPASMEHPPFTLNLGMVSMEEAWCRLSQYHKDRHNNKVGLACVVLSHHQNKVFHSALNGMTDITPQLKTKFGTEMVDKFVYRQDLQSRKLPVAYLNSTQLSSELAPAPRLKFLIKGRYCGLNVTVMVDTGATHSFVSKSLTTMAGNRCKLHPKAKVPVIHAANNELLVVEGTATAKLKLGQFNQQLDLIVMQEQIPGIDIVIGTDLILKYKIDCLTSCDMVRLHYRGHVYKIPVLYKGNNPEKEYVAASHVVEQKLQSDFNPIESKQQLRKALFKHDGRLIMVWPKHVVEDTTLATPQVDVSQPRVINNQPKPSTLRVGKKRVSFAPNLIASKAKRRTLYTSRDVDTQAHSAPSDAQDAEPEKPRAPDEGPEANARFEEKIKHHPDLIQKVLRKHRKVFKEDLPSGIDSKYQFWAEAIPTEPHTPPFRQMYRLTEKEREEVQRQIKIWFEEKKILRESHSPYNSPILFVSKPDGSLRMVVDYRKINDITVKNRFPLPRIQDLIDMLSGAKYFSSLDLVNGYRQIALQPSDIPKTAFSTPWGHYESMVLWDGLCNAPSIFSHIMHKELTPYIGQFCTVYIDDVLIFSKTIEEHAVHLDKVLQRLYNANLYVKITKCDFLKESIKFLGHIITPEGVKADPAKVDKVLNWTTPTKGKDVMKFLGLTNYFRQYIPHYADISAPLENVKQHKGIFDDTVWTSSQQTSFDGLKQALTSAPVLKIPDRENPFTVICDASLYGVGAILMQSGRPCAFLSKKFTKEQIGYITYEQELTAVIEALEQWRCYLEGVHFTLQTDHKPLTYYNKLPTLNRRQARWLQLLSKFDFTWEHIKGTSNPADPLSRHPDFDFSPSEQEKLCTMYPAFVSFNDSGRLNFLNEFDTPYVLMMTRAGTDRSVVYNQQQIQKMKNKLKQRNKQDFKSKQQHTAHACEVDIPLQIAGGFPDTLAGAQRGPKGDSLQKQTGGFPEMTVGAVQEQEDDYHDSHNDDTIVNHATSADEFQNDGLNPFLTRIIQSYSKDPDFSRKTNRKNLLKTKTGLYMRQEVEGKHGKFAQIIIPNDEQLRKDIIEMCHNEQMAGHRGVKATLEKVRRNFYWWGINTDVERYVSTCLQCQSNKVSPVPKAELKPLQRPQRRWQSISLDLITDLPKTSNGKDCILVVVDRFSKMCHFIPCTKTLSTNTFAQMLLDHIVRYHGLPESIVSDRDPRFATSEFIQQFYQLSGIRKFNSTAYHPESDGQTERMNRVLEEVLRMFVNEDQKNWAKLLPMAEFAINDSHCQSIGTTPFFLNYGFHPSSPANVGLPAEGHEHAAHKVLSQFMALEKRAAALLEQAVQRMTAHENKGRKPRLFTLNQRVMLNTKNLRLPGCSKFLPRFIGPFDLTRMISSHAYELKMPARWSRVHPVFHVNLLKIFKEDPDKYTPSLCDSTSLDIDMTYTVDNIISHKVTEKEIQYEVHYSGMSDAVNTMEKEEDLLLMCPALLEAYKAKHKLT